MGQTHSIQGSKVQQAWLSTSISQRLKQAVLMKCLPTKRSTVEIESQNHALEKVYCTNLRRPQTCTSRREILQGRETPSIGRLCIICPVLQLLCSARSLRIINEPPRRYITALTIANANPHTPSIEAITTYRE